jgi:hypothetical protein
MAEALGAALGQGRLFDRVADGPAPGYPLGELVLPRPAEAHADANGSSYARLPPSVQLRRSPEPLLITPSEQLDRVATPLVQTRRAGRRRCAGQ